MTPKLNQPKPGAPHTTAGKVAPAPRSNPTNGGHAQPNNPPGQKQHHVTNITKEPNMSASTHHIGEPKINDALHLTSCNRIRGSSDII
jgi:hypothetical protein